jgi:hypothetical protein
MRPGILSHVYLFGVTSRNGLIEHAKPFATPIATRLNLLGYRIEAMPLSSHAAIESQAL